MLLVDVNVLVYAFREDSPRHTEFRDWLQENVNSGQPFAVADLVLSGFIRITTHPKIFSPPTPLPEAIRFAVALREQPNCVHLAPGPRHWEIFIQLCQETSAKGNAVPDAFLAALAIESGAEWITTDGGFARFSGLHCRHPLT